MDLKKILLRALPVVLLASVTAFSAEEIKITELVTTARQDCPVQIISLKLPRESSTLPRAPIAMLHNTSSTAVADVDLSDYLGDPFGTVDGKLVPTGIGPYNKVESG